MQTHPLGSDLSRFGIDLGSSWGRFGLNENRFGSIWVDLGLSWIDVESFDSIWDRCLLILCWVRIDFGFAYRESQSDSSGHLHKPGDGPVSPSLVSASRQHREPSLEATATCKDTAPWMVSGLSMHIARSKNFCMDSGSHVVSGSLEMCTNNFSMNHTNGNCLVW